MIILGFVNKNQFDLYSSVINKGHGAKKACKWLRASPWCPLLLLSRQWICSALQYFVWYLYLFVTICQYVLQPNNTVSVHCRICLKSVIASILWNRAKRKPIKNIFCYFFQPSYKYVSHIIYIVYIPIFSTIFFFTFSSLFFFFFCFIRRKKLLG